MSAFNKKSWVNRVTEYINRRLLTYTDGHTELVTVSRDEGIIAVEGDAFNSATMNDLEERIDLAFENSLGDNSLEFDGSNFYVVNGDVRKKLGSSEGTATTNQVLVGATFNSKNTLDSEEFSTGTMPNHSGKVQACGGIVQGSTVALSIPSEGYYDQTSKVTVPRDNIQKPLSVVVRARLNPEGSQYCGEAHVTINGQTYSVVTQNSNDDVSKTQTFNITV